MTDLAAKLNVGSQVYLSTSLPATYDETGYEALTWVEVKGVESIGAFGGKSNITNFTPVNSGVVQKLKGSFDYGQVSLPLSNNPADAGQIALKEAFDGANKEDVHAFKFSTSDGYAKYLTGLVSSFEYAGGDANSVDKVNCTVEVNTKPVVVAPD